MHPKKLRFIAFNALGGAAIVGSYLHGILTKTEPGKALWGGVPQPLQPLYTVSMLTATAGFLKMFSYFHSQDPDTARVFGGRFSLSSLYVPLGVIHVASSLWMPLTFKYLESPSPAMWAAVRGVLLLTGAGALMMIAAVATTSPRKSGRTAALIGACAFAFQTAVLDALVWPALY
jgi:hypothetical protein